MIYQHAYWDPNLIEMLRKHGVWCVFHKGFWFQHTLDGTKVSTTIIGKTLENWR